MNKGIHLKGLNGIRAIAALAVVISHTILGLNGFNVLEIKNGWEFASYGVSMFFSLSGFLITYLLLLEKSKFSTISIKKFYTRRILRIWPLYYLYFFIALAVTFFWQKQSLSDSIWFYPFLLANIPIAIQSSIPLLVHFWSLGVEEQFYLFWPWLVRITSPIKLVLVFTIAFFALKLAIRIFTGDGALYQFIYYTRFDCMAIGAMGAILYYNNIEWFKKLLFNKITQILSWALLLSATNNFLHIPDFIIHEIVAAITVVIIINAAFNEKPLVPLENKIFDFLGKISYGIYVYHVLIIFLLQKLLTEPIVGMNMYLQIFVIFTSVVLSTILTAYLSYRYFENPFLKLKYKFSKIASHS